MAITSVQELINKIAEKKIMNSKVNPTALEDFLKSELEVKTYISFVEKRELCEEVLERSCNAEGNLVEVDSVSRYLLFTIAMITKYTALTFGNNENSDSIDDYDLLCQSGLLNAILGVIGEEYTVCNNMLNMMMADITANNNNIAAVLDKSAQRLLNIIDDFENVLADKIDSLNLDLDSIDLDKYKEIIEKLK